jgi:4-amino-4-deoxy-L-arabinose transferase-like glycosyltransferase
MKFSDKKQKYTLFFVLIGAVGLRLILFDEVAVHFDTGRYIYDSLLILDGKTPMIDFTSRSPLFHHLFAASFKFGLSRIITVRILMLIFSIIVGVLVYIWTRRISSPDAAIVATVIYLFTPFTAVWGLQLKTELVAEALAIVGILLTVKQLDKKSIPSYHLIMSGGFFGAAFLIRRVIIIHIGSIVLFCSYYFLFVRHKTCRRKGNLLKLSLIPTAAVATIIIGYGLITQLSVSQSQLLVNKHLIGLIGTEVSRGATSSSKEAANILQVCRHCGIKTITNLIRAGLNSLPVIIGMAVPAIITFRQYNENRIATIAVPILIVFTPWFGAALSIIIAPQVFEQVLLSAIILSSGMIFMWYAPVEAERENWSPHLLLPLIIVIMLLAGYLYRDRTFFTPYFQDLYPYLCILSGITIKSFSSKINSGVYNSINLNKVWVSLVVLSVVASFAMPNPLLLSGVPTRGAPQELDSISEVRTVNTDIESRTDPGDKILTGQPLYVIDSNRYMAANLSRDYYKVKFNRSGKQGVIRGLSGEIENRTVSYVIMDRTTKTMMDNSGRLRQDIMYNYCIVDNDTAYREHNTRLWKLSERAPSCE